MSKIYSSCIAIPHAILFMSPLTWLSYLTTSKYCFPLHRVSNKRLAGRKTRDNSKSKLEGGHFLQDQET